MDEKHIRQCDRELLEKQLQNIDQSFMQAGRQVFQGRARVSTYWTIEPSQLAVAYAPINLPHLGKIFEEEISKKEIVTLENRLSSMQEIMTKRFDILTNKIDKLSKKIESVGKTQEKVVVLKTISREQAKNEIKAYFRKNDGKKIGYSDIVKNLNIDLKMVVEICNELMEEGDIG